MADPNPASDRYFDLSLRLLTVFVLVSLVCCVGFLSYRWLAPRLLRAPATPVQSRSSIIVSPAPASTTPRAPPEEVLMDPHKTFRCVEKGRVSFSDRACGSGSEQILPLAPPPAGANH
jgi:hypothetical protein